MTFLFVCCSRHSCSSPLPQVYKENLVETILPSIQSVMTAVLHYKKMGGEANLYINDDGLQVCRRTRFLDTLASAAARERACPLFFAGMV